jgi:hypothetical protein
MTDWWYWALFVGAVILIGAVPLAHVWEQKQDDRDRKTWKEMWRR